jgi:lipopolysaccharide export system permease protein
MLFTKIDRYLLFLYFRVLTICFLSISGLLIVIHVFSNLDSLNKHSSENQISLLDVCTDYYGPYLLSIFERLSALLALMAMLFTLAWLSKTNELTALLAAGVPKRRILRPLWLASFLVIGTAVGFREFAIPPFQDRLDRSPEDLSGVIPRPIRPAYDPDNFSLIQGRHLLPINRQIVDVQIKLRGGVLGSAIGSKLTASLATFVPANADHADGYLLEGVTMPRSLDKKPSVVDQHNRPLLLTSFDNAWLASGSCFLVSSIEYEALRGGSSWQDFASTSELITQLKTEKSPSSGDDLRVSIHQRFVRPLVDWSVLLLCIPILFGQPDRHMFWLAGVSLGMVGGFAALCMGLAAMGASGYLLSPSLAVWLPVLIGLPWGWAKTQKAVNT